MANIASVLKEEISRLSRKEVKAETERLKKSSAQYRSEIASLKRRVTDLEHLVSKLMTGTTLKAVPVESEAEEFKVRFSSKGFKTLRAKFGISAAALGTLLAVSAQTIYSWEVGTTRPRQQQLVKIAHLRSLTKRQVLEII